VAARYFGRFHPSRRDRWVFGDRDSGAFLIKFAAPPMDKTSLLLAVRQQGLCPLCKQALIVGAEYEPDSPREWINWFAASKKMLHKHHFTYRRDGGTDERNNLRLVHSECHRQHHAGDSKRTTQPC
ncbi:HNH endonuclease, partial [Streptomyces sp. NPDC007264]|uniref:HNH endonuclease n=1 Tax=Streptomyces sp. NPDC007264 TaxID=3364777 RepID=UPI0036DE9252